MTEKRRSARIPITMHLCISDLYKEDQLLSGIHDLDSPIRILDISKTGFSFLSECVLPTGYYFNAHLDLSDCDRTTLTLIKIVRSKAIERDQYLYGCEFTDLPGNIMKMLEKYTD